MNHRRQSDREDRINANRSREAQIKAFRAEARAKKKAGGEHPKIVPFALTVAAEQLGFKINPRTAQVWPVDDPLTGGVMTGATASIVSEGQLRQRYTMTRLAVLGIFALGAKKTTSDVDIYITIDGGLSVADDAFSITVRVGSDLEQVANRFVRAFNELAADFAVRAANAESAQATHRA